MRGGQTVKKHTFLILFLFINAVILSTNITISANSNIYIRGDRIAVDLSRRNLTNEQLAEMVANGEIPYNVTVLYLGINQISDLTPLSVLTDLQELSVNNNQISDLSPLSELKNLNQLSLPRNQITDITPLSNLTNLGGAFGTLNLRDNQITDLSPLSNLTNLEWLTIRDNPISDLTPLESLTNLNVNWMNFRGTDVTPEQVEHLKEAIRLNRNTPPLGFLTEYLRAHPDSAVDVAIEILRYVVGLPPGEHFGVLQVDLGYEPRVDDAIEVLKWVAGLESVLGA
jgi:Leucine-rich repeat (LRR) protein